MKAERNVRGDDGPSGGHDETMGKLVTSRRTEDATHAAPVAAVETERSEVAALLRPKIKASPWQDRR